MVMCVGRSGCGKTTWAVQTAANIVRPFENSCIFHDDIEGGITLARRKALTGFTEDELESKYIIRNSGITAENFYARLKMIYDIKVENEDEYLVDTGFLDTRGRKIFKMVPTVYILDSLALLMPEKYTDEEELSGQMSATAAAKTNSSIFKRIIPMLSKANIILIVINHITTKIEINPMMHTKGQLAYLKQGEETPGGRTVNYLADLFIRFDDNTKFKENEGFAISGNMVDITLVKSRNARAGQSTTMVFNQSTGFDPELSLFVMLKNAGKIKGAGAYLYIEGHDDIKFSQRTFKDTLIQSLALQEYFSEAVSEVLKSIPVEVGQTYAENHDISRGILAKINTMNME
jgi:RecA/RadA recombinase